MSKWVAIKFTFYQDDGSDLGKYMKEGETILAAFAIVAEHGPKTLNRFKALLEG